VEILIYVNVQPPGAVGALGGNLDHDTFRKQAPLHEGRGECVFGSSAVNEFTGAETDAVRRGFACQRECPGDLASAVARQKEQMLFQIAEQLLHARNSEAKCTCELRRV
jgi:hypothetical protein